MYTTDIFGSRRLKHQASAKVNGGIEIDLLHSKQ